MLTLGWLWPPLAPGRSALRLSQWVLSVIWLPLLLCACANQEPAPATLTAPIQSISYDGRYVGTINITQGVQNQDWCFTPPSFSVTVSGNAFSFTLRHPKMPDAPLYNPTFDMHIGADGSFGGPGGEQAIAMMKGRVNGRQMTGEISGTLCELLFSADRV